MGVYLQQQRYSEKVYKLESDLERDVVNNAKIFFGPNAIYIDAKRKIESKSLGGSIPDGFLFDFSDVENPVFYIVEAELSNHAFFGHIFPQITKFIGFFNNYKSKMNLVSKLYTIINEDEELLERFNSLSLSTELYKSLIDVIEISQNILIIIDGEKEEIPDILETYTEWREMVKVIILKKYSDGINEAFSFEPEFEDVEYSLMNKETSEDEDGEMKEFTEADHLKKSNQMVNSIYNQIKNELIHKNPGVTFNATKKYISIISQKRIAHFRFNVKSLKLVIMKEKNMISEQIPSFHIKPGSPGVQKFWNGPCCEIQFKSEENINEVISLLKTLI
ncbi:hypothetical protein [Bacillus sp. AFS096315]|uniref:hypothetical protein n=1 Tax=Bacillus sp. AFS096315 TaxID=2033517 RepID=UPI000BEE01EA|nr:hypothetical protein [Bacillus sp. AFS096315]PEC46373.1 hypothetical protein CON00_23925 [Bacillus sp. AFS096315]